jgi:hypothetical protein
MPDATLPPCCPPLPSCHRRIQRRRCAASSALALPMPPPNCPPSPRRCRAASAALPTLPPRIRRCRPAATTVTVLPPPSLPLCHPDSSLFILAAAALLPPPLRCDASAALPAVAAPLPRCLRRSVNAATTLPPLTLRCRCHLRAACFCRAAAVLLLVTLPPRCQRRRRAAAAATALPPPARCLDHSPFLSSTECNIFLVCRSLKIYSLK